MVETPAPFFSRSVVNLQSLPFSRLCQDSRSTTLLRCVHPEYELGKTLEKTLSENQQSENNKAALQSLSRFSGVQLTLAFTCFCPE